MMISVNGEVLEVQANTLFELFSELNLTAEGVAVAVNNRIVMRTQWNTFWLHGGEEVVVIGTTRGG